VVRVVVTGQPARVLLQTPQVVGDSLVGVRVERVGGARGARVAVPLASVTSVEAERLSGGRTAGAVVGMLVLFPLVVLWGSLSSYRN
jgi:hypothetical protein